MVVVAQMPTVSDLYLLKNYIESRGYSAYIIEQYDSYALSFPLYVKEKDYTAIKSIVDDYFKKR